MMRDVVDVVVANVDVVYVYTCRPSAVLPVRVLPAVSVSPLPYTPVFTYCANAAAGKVHSTPKYKRQKWEIGACIQRS